MSASRGDPPIGWPRARGSIQGVYVHVPFCASDCAYCVFSREVPAGRRAVGEYLDAIEREAGVWRARFEGRLSARTLYVGGGTPTFLDPNEWDRLSGAIDRIVDRSSLVEITVEANPESATPDRLERLRAFGTTRISIGAQSSRADTLALLGRTHDFAEVVRAVAAARAAGIGAVSLDLIYGVPGLATAAWEETLGDVLRLAPDHLSAYCLTFEEGSALTRRRRLGRLNDQADDTVRDQYDRLVSATARLGLDRYEVSSFGTGRGRSLHNLGYWHRDPFLGLGPSAHSFVDGHRFRNRMRREDWARALLDGAPFIASHERLGPAEIVAEELLRLRTSDGVPHDRLPVGAGFKRRVRDLAEEGLLETNGEGHGRLALAPDAYFVSDEIIADLLAAYDMEADA